MASKAKSHLPEATRVSKPAADPKHMKGIKEVWAAWRALLDQRVAMLELLLDSDAHTKYLALVEEMKRHEARVLAYGPGSDLATAIATAKIKADLVHKHMQALGAYPKCDCTFRLMFSIMCVSDAARGRQLL